MSKIYHAKFKNRHFANLHFVKKCSYPKRIKTPEMLSGIVFQKYASVREG